jgi:hypothetical protein
MDLLKYIELATSNQSYTERKLLDVTELGIKVGFSVPVVVTEFLFRDIMTDKPTDDSTKLVWHLHSVLFEAYTYSKHEANQNASEFIFHVPNTLEEEISYWKEYKYVLGSGEDGLPRIALMLGFEH